ncbi:EcsC family protein [Nevskia soli]|uniref:EcsC family protein n=1 Tax=Nevskia soli TaxID=418856 RepID=UPI0004A78633|nr:EcsC family protein [Nevskia soli]
MSPLNEYEHEQLALIRAWRGQQPGLATRTIGHATGPLANAAEKMVPTLALRLALDAVHATAVRITDRRSILKRGGVAHIEDLRLVELEICDRLAQQVSRRAAMMAGGSGAVFGLAGGLGLIADLPTLLTLTFRTIHRIGLCYGEDLAAPERRRLPVAVFALASANSMQEKAAALAAIDSVGEVDDTIDHEAGVDGVSRAAQRELAKDSVAFSLNNLGKSLARNLGWRKAGESLPVIGALVGGSVNAWYLRDLARSAQYTFQLRWLRQKYGHEHALHIAGDETT